MAKRVLAMLAVLATTACASAAAQPATDVPTPAGRVSGAPSPPAAASPAPATAGPAPAATSPAPPAAAPAPRLLPTLPERPRVMVVGDSLSVGYFASAPGAAFPAVLAGGLGGPLVADVAHSGYTVAEDDRLVQAAPATPADLLVVESGTNDSIRRLNPQASAAAYPRLLADAKAKSGGAARLVCLGAWGAPEATAAYDAVLAPVCQQAGGIFVPVSAIFVDPATRGPRGARAFIAARDTFHPNDTGHARIAAAVAAVFGH